MTRIIAYVDGFNLYHAIDNLNRPALKWLDLNALITSLARAGETVTEVNYFSATRRTTDDGSDHQENKALPVVHLASSGGSAGAKCIRT